MYPRFRLRRRWLVPLGIGLGVLLAVISANFVRSEKKIQNLVESPYGTDDAQFIRAVNTLLGAPLVGGNTVTELVNGDQIFPAMQEAIRGAQKTITFETFIYWSGRTGKEFADAFTERARAGVRILILLDWFGSVKMESRLLNQMAEAGCQIERYHAPKWYHLTRLNNRTHRKTLVVDGRIGFTGGVGIGDEWTGNAQDPQHWRDTHFKVVGPVVAQMQPVFMVNWIKARATVEHTIEFLPPPEPAGNQVAQMFHSSPGEGSENIRLMYLLSIAAARRSILLEQAYFVPDDLVVRMLVAAAKRGVAVNVIVPGEHFDTPHVREASRSRLGPLLEAGIRIFEYQPTNLHSKIMVVDGIWSSVGSTNFDNCAFRINDEANLNIYDRDFAAQMERTLANDRAASREITYDEWKRLPWYVNVGDRFWALFRQQM